MKKKLVKRLFALTTASVMAVSLTACGSSGDQKKEESNNAGDAGDAGDDGNDAENSSGGGSSELKAYADIELGKDYTDVSADLKFLTHKTDAVDNKFAAYVEEFKKMYPNVNIEYEGITDYANDITTRLTTGDWGDICMVPTTVDKDELENFFVNFGSKTDLSGKYEANMLNNYAYGDSVYGIPSMANVQGVIYNKKVFEQAGVTQLPKTPDEFLAALKSIKEKTDVEAPLYTNFAAQWTMSAWDAYIDGGSTGDPDFNHQGLTKGKDPFADRGDGTGPFAVYNVLYEAVKQGLTEEDPTTTDWEGSKGMLNNGKIGCVVLGSWAVTQMQQAGDNASDIGYMAFPISVDGKQYAAAGPDYCYGINVNSSDDNKAAAMCYIKWLVEESDFAQSEGGLSIVTGAEYPEALAALEGVELVVNNAAPEGEETLFNDVNNDSELGLNVSGAIAIEIVEEAIGGTKTMADLSAEWNEKWTAAQESNGVKPQ